MRNIRHSFVAAMAVVAISATSAAAAAPVWFDEADNNHDRRLSWSEYVGEESKFDILDGNGDGLVTKRDRFLADGLDESSWVYAASMDTNGSGAVTWAEYHEQLRATFDLFDRNGDGTLSDREVDGSRRGRPQEAGRTGDRDLTVRALGTRR